MRILIKGGTLVNDGRVFSASLLIDNDRIADIIEKNETSRGDYDEMVDATGCFVLPGVIDDHVHFREPGLTDKADIRHESRAAAYGGVTSYFEMPNTIPQTTTLEALDDKFRRAAEESYVNYSFFFGATNDNHGLFGQIDRHRIPGVKLFMGSSTGNMLVEGRPTLKQVFLSAAAAGLPVMTHCEDTEIINRNMKAAKQQFGDDPGVEHHPAIRSEEACYRSTELAVALARECRAQLHVAHVSTAKELELFDPQDHGEHPVTMEICVPHLCFSEEDYATKGALIKCNPAVKTCRDRAALRQFVSQAPADGLLTIGTDHAPHLLSQKQGGCAKAVSGMPMVQFSLVAMLEQVVAPSDEGLHIEQVVQLMCHHPARLFQVDGRGFLRKGYKADIAIVREGRPWTLTEEMIQSKCRWSPLTGQTFRWRVEHTFCNGRHLYNNGVFDEAVRGEQLTFRQGR